MKIKCIVGMALLSLATVSGAATLKYGTFVSSSHKLMTDAVDPFIDRVQSAPDSDVTFKVFADGSLVGSTTSFKGMVGGLIDMAHVLPNYTPGNFPYTGTLAQLPPYESNVLAETGAINELIFLHCKGCTDEWKKQGAEMLSVTASTPYYLQCVKPIEGMDSLKGRRVHGNGVWAEWVTELGATSVALPISELFSALNQGTLDCATGALTYLDSYGLKDVVRSILELPTGDFRPIVLMSINSKKFAKLNANDRKAIIDNLPKLTADSAWASKLQEEEIRQRLGDRIKFVEPDDKIREATNLAIQKSEADFVKIAQKRGVKDASELLSNYRSLLNKWLDLVKPINSEEDYLALLNQRVFTKVSWSD